MQEKFRSDYKILIFDLIIYLLCLLGIYQIYLKAGLPIDLSFIESETVVNSIISGSYKNLIGGKIISIDGYNFSSREELEVYLDGKNIGDTVKLVISKNNIFSYSNIKLIHFYSGFYLIIVFIVCTLFFAIAIFILLKAREKKQAKYYHAVNVTAATLMMTTWGNYIFEPHGIGIAIRVSFHLACALAPVLFLHFIFVFPKDTEEKNWKILLSIYIVSVIIFLLLNYSFFKVINEQELEAFKDYIQATNLFRGYIIILTIWGIYIFIKNYIKSESLAERKKIKWLLLGFLIGPGGYILLWVLPQSFTTHGLLPEEFIIVFMSAVPITFGISIYHYRLLDIDIIFNKSTVYAIVIAVAATIYLTIISIIPMLVSSLTYQESIYISSAAALIIGLLFQPLKNKVQNFIDKKFFRINYNFKTAHILLAEEIANSFTIEVLTNKIKEKINEILQPVNILIYLPGSDMNLLPVEDQNKINRIISIINSSKTILADKDYFEGENNFVFFDQNEYNFKLIFPLITSDNSKGFIALGKKKSLIRYNLEDIDFLEDVAAQTKLASEKINLQKEIVLKQEESKKLKLLNETKSLFVSSVSHELKTPLTSIKMFTQILQGKEVSVEKKNIYLKIIEKEGDRLTRLIDNILDFTKIEKGIMEYTFREIDLNDVLRETLTIVENQFEIDVIFYGTSLSINADKDAVKGALINLISNATKYSGNNKVICIKTFLERNFAGINIQDNGIGIPEKDIKNIFEPFKRLNNFDRKKIDGIGIGLSIVKHTMDSHKGLIKIESEQGSGSCFTLLFPLMEIYEKNIDN